MQFKIDENLPVEVAQLLHAAGHDALTVLDQKLGGRADRLIASVLRTEKRALITLDLDFADIRTFPPAEYFGLIVLRLAVQDKQNVLALIARIIPVLTQEPLIGTLWVVSHTDVRIRGELA